MKFSIVVLAVLASVVAAEIGDERDLSDVVPILQIPEVRAGYKQLADVPIKRTPVFQSRIVNGAIAVPHNHPYQVALLMAFPTGTGFCGGSVLSPQWVYTAAHCVDDTAMIQVRTVFGAHQITVVEPSQQERIVPLSAITIHPEWDRGTLRNDVAVLFIAQAVTLNNFVQPIRLTPARLNNVDLTGTQATTTGWGQYSDDSPNISPVLRIATKPVITEAACRVRFPFVIQPSHICVDGGAGSPCSGDSGGPMTMHDVDGQLTQIGCVSFGLALGCELSWPGVYSRSTSFTGWVSSVTHLTW